jgi:1,4-dihydroxy-2-naphthoyl-CoA hydrolase
MGIWKNEFTLEALNAFGENNMAGYLDIKYNEYGDDFISATMPVTAKTVQPFRILHGGASVVLAETLGSVASNLCIEDLTKYSAVGLEINANHLKGVHEGGIVMGTCKPIRIGKNVHVWSIEIRDEKGELTCISRLTVSIIERR